MPTLHRDLSLALQLQGLDLRIASLTQEIDGLPRSIALVEGRLATHKEELEREQARLAENRKQRRLLERKVEDLRRKISGLHDQMNSARTNQQFRAFQHEIQYCRDVIDTDEEEILGKMEEAEDLERVVAAAQASLNKESVQVATDVRAAKARIEVDKSEREKRIAERSAVAARLDPSVLRIYERIRQTRGIAVAEVGGENCSSCHVRLRPKLLQDLRQLDSGVLCCESCGLIVHFPEESDR